MKMSERQPAERLRIGKGVHGREQPGYGLGSQEEMREGQFFRSLGRKKMTRVK